MTSVGANSEHPFPSILSALQASNMPRADSLFAGLFCKWDLTSHSICTGPQSPLPILCWRAVMDSGRGPSLWCWFGTAMKTILWYTFPKDFAVIFPTHTPQNFIGASCPPSVETCHIDNYLFNVYSNGMLNEFQHHNWIGFSGICRLQGHLALV